jgi:hypothetical protein
LINKKIKEINLMKKYVKTSLSEDMGGVSSPGATLNNVPGMGSAVPPAKGGVGSGDNWGNINKKPYTQSASPKRKRKKIRRKKPIKSISEKFQEKSDPIHDLGIGRKRVYDDDVIQWITDMSEELPSAMEIYLPEKKCIDLYNKVIYENYKIKSLTWSDDDGRKSNWYNRKIQKYLDKGWKIFNVEDNMDQAEYILIKPPVLEEENLNPYDKVGNSIAKQMGVKPPFKKVKSKDNQNAMTQQKFEHQIISLEDYLNEESK